MCLNCELGAMSSQSAVQFWRARLCTLNNSRVCVGVLACASHLRCRSVSGSNADLLPTAACQLSLFVTSYIAMRVHCEANDVQLTSVAAAAGLSLGNSFSFFLFAASACDSGAHYMMQRVIC